MEYIIYLEEGQEHKLISLLIAMVFHSIENHQLQKLQIITYRKCRKLRQIKTVRKYKTLRKSLQPIKQKNQNKLIIRLINKNNTSRKILF